MNKTEAISKLRKSANAVKGMGATALYLFGSTARDETSQRSDLDLFTDYDASRRFSLIDLIAIKQLLEEEMAVEVDVTTRDSLHPMLKEDIERSAIRVF
ncbi:nucleotidyltransferase family protein [Mesorhizobium sp. AaZ16]|uniref:nucleotidyltransferase family protein n=1 Tax=Mesorhizobium sp. AaZ16 TaxID=3402289 RepID=UPI00374FB1BF